MASLFMPSCVVMSSPWTALAGVLFAYGGY